MFTLKHITVQHQKTETREQVTPPPKKRLLGRQADFSTAARRRGDVTAH